MKIRLVKHSSTDVLEILTATRSCKSDDPARKPATLLRHSKEIQDQHNRIFFTAIETGGEHVAYVQLILKNSGNDPDLANGRDLAHIQ
jgi:hypothetical protein